MKKNKYYTPDLEEFHIGFEYEWLNENNDWVKESTPSEITVDGFDEQTYGLRVKYLDKEDIESLGFKHVESKDSPYVKGEYFDTFKFYREDGFNTGLHVQLEKLGKEEIIIKTEYISSWGGGKGEISLKLKNKSELKKLMKMLGI